MGDGGLRDIISKPAWIVIVGANRLRETETLNQIILVCWGLAPIPPNNKNNTKRQSGRSFVFVGWVPFRILLGGGEGGDIFFLVCSRAPLCVLRAEAHTQRHSRRCARAKGLLDLWGREKDCIRSALHAREN